MSDLISRQAAIDACLDGFCACVNDCVNEIKKLPSVTPKPKIGKWIAQEDELGEYASGCFECSNCHEVFWVESGTPQDNEYNYCPNCGADMRGEQDE